MAVCFDEDIDEVRVDDEGQPDAWFPCFVSTQDEESGGGYGAPFYPALRWIENGQRRKTLKVKFLEFGMKGGVKEDFRIRSWRQKAYPYNYVTTMDILKWANEWSSKKNGLNGIVPEFIECPEEEDGDIRVRFVTGPTGSSSYNGKEAKSYGSTYTMTLNLAVPDRLKGDVDDYRQYIVTHEFGHALGLGHEHQSSRLAGYLNREKVVEGLVKRGLSWPNAVKMFDKDYAQYREHGGPKEWSEFDPWSTMSYPLNKELFNDVKTFMMDRKVTTKEFEMLTSQCYNERKVLSEIDIKTVKKLYSSVILNIQVRNTSSYGIILSLLPLQQGQWITKLPSYIKSYGSAQGTIEDVSKIIGSPLMKIIVEGREFDAAMYEISFDKQDNCHHSLPVFLPHLGVRMFTTNNVFPSENYCDCILTILNVT